MMRASIVLNVPAAILFVIGILSLQVWLGVYTHFVNQDAPGLIRYACEMHPRGDHLIRQDTGDDPAKAIPCLCSSLSGCRSVSDVENMLMWRIAESSLYIVAGAALVSAFVATRKYLKAHGILDKRPRTISLLGSIFAAISIVSFHVLISIGTWSDWVFIYRNNFYIVEDFFYIPSFAFFAVAMPLGFLALAICIFVLGKKSWLWKTAIVFLLFSIAMILVSFDHFRLAGTYWNYVKHVSLALCFIGLYLLIIPETRAYYSPRHHAKPSIA